MWKPCRFFTNTIFLKLIQNFAVKPFTCCKWFHLSFENFDIISTVNYSFYHNWVIPSVVIGWELCSVRVQTIKMMWWCCNLFSLSWEQDFPGNFNGNRHQNSYCQCYGKKKKTQTNNNFPWSALLSAIENQMMSKCSKLCSKTIACDSLLLNTLTSFLWLLRVQTKENCCRFVK